MSIIGVPPYMTTPEANPSVYCQMTSVAEATQDSNHHCRPLSLLQVGMRF